MDTPVKHLNSTCFLTCTTRPTAFPQVVGRCHVAPGYPLLLVEIVTDVILVFKTTRPVASFLRQLKSWLLF
jgi:hypothetical protein